MRYLRTVSPLSFLTRFFGGCLRGLSEGIFRFLIFAGVVCDGCGGGGGGGSGGGGVRRMAKLSSSDDSLAGLVIALVVLSAVKSIGSSDVDVDVSPLIDLSNNRFVSKICCFDKDNVLSE